MLRIFALAAFVAVASLTPVHAADAADARSPYGHVDHRSDAGNGHRQRAGGRAESGPAGRELSSAGQYRRAERRPDFAAAGLPARTLIHPNDQKRVRANWACARFFFASTCLHTGLIQPV